MQFLQQDNNAARVLEARRNETTLTFIVSARAASRRPTHVRCPVAYRKRDYRKAERGTKTAVNRLSI